MTKYKQLVKPNRKVVGIVTWCLQYVRQVFGRPAVEPTAREAWDKAKYKHKTTVMPNVAVPVFWSWFGTVDGVYKDWGHVAWYDPTDKTFSGSPFKTATGWEVTRSLDAMTKQLNQYGKAKYLGWTEDISGKRLVEPIPEPKAPKLVIGKRIARKGTATVLADKLNVRADPSTKKKAVATYKKGEKFKYDSYIIINGYVWLSYIAKSGKRRYVAEGPYTGKADKLYVKGGIS